MIKNPNKKLLLGNEAIARGAYEACVKVVSSYPGTPSTEITEYIAKYDEIFTEWAPNEKVSMEVALGASVAGTRSLCAMKHVGLNVAADPLFTASYTGVTGGMVICVADDQGMHSSQNEQDSRNYANAAKVLMLEPSDSEECRDYVVKAFELSEKFDTPALIRLSTRVSHSRSLVEIKERLDISNKPFKKDPRKYVMMPAMAKLRHTFVEKRIASLREYAETSDLNRVYKRSDDKSGDNIGVIASGIAYQYAREALGDKVSYLKLGIMYPLPEKLISDFYDSVDTCYVIEELDPYIENHCKKLGLNVLGKDVFSKAIGGISALEGEYSAELIRKTVFNEIIDKIEIEKTEALPQRPPVMCAGCPHRGVFHALKQLNLTVTGDIGCYTLSALPPLSMIDTCVCMGASVGMAHGIEMAGGINGEKNKTVAVIGDSTFIHSGITGLIDIVYNKGASTVIILDNSITGMTGHQQNPTTGFTIKGEPTRQVDLKKLCEAVGVTRVRVSDPFDTDEFIKIVREEINAGEPSVIIAQRPCALLKTVKYTGKYIIDAEKCKNCGICLKPGCPSMIKKDGKPFIDPSLCVGCGYCAGLCKFNSITREGDK